MHFRILILNFYVYQNLNIKFLCINPLIMPMRAMHTQIRLMELYPFVLKESLMMEPQYQNM